MADGGFACHVDSDCADGYFCNNAAACEAKVVNTTGGVTGGHTTAGTTTGGTTTAGTTTGGTTTGGTGGTTTGGTIAFEAIFTQTPPAYVNTSGTQVQFRLGSQGRAGTINFRCTLRAGEPDSTVPTGLCNPDDFYTFPNSGEGAYTFYVLAVDTTVSPEVRSPVKTHRFLLDRTVPTVTFMAPLPPDVTTQTSFQFGISGADAVSGIASYLCTATPSGTCQVSQSQTQWTGLVSGLTDGQYTVRISATDHAGNVATTERTVIVDNTPPTMGSIDVVGAVLTGGKMYISSTTPAVDLTATDPGMGASQVVSFRGSLDNSLPGTLFTRSVNANDKTVSIPHGEHTLWVDAVDAAGNISQAIGSDITVEERQPDVTATGVTEGEVLSTRRPPLAFGCSVGYEPCTFECKVSASVGQAYETCYSPLSDWMAGKGYDLSNGIQALSIRATGPSGLQTILTRNVDVEVIGPTVDVTGDVVSNLDSITFTITCNPSCTLNYAVDSDTAAPVGGMTGTLFTTATQYVYRSSTVGPGHHALHLHAVGQNGVSTDKDVSFFFSDAVVAAGENHSCAIRVNYSSPTGSAACWGAAGMLQLGDGTTRASDRGTLGSDVVTTSAPDNWAVMQSSAVSNHTCGIKRDGTMWCWGDNRFGQVGHASTGPVSEPNVVAGGLQWGIVSPGGRHTCAIAANQELYCWGDNTYGQLGRGSMGGPSDNQPVRINSPGGPWITVSAGQNHTCAIAGTGTSGKLYCWGDDMFCNLGRAACTAPGASPQSSPLQVGSGTDWSEVAAGPNFTVALRGGQPFGWGLNSYGQLGASSAPFVAPGSANTALHWASNWEKLAVGKTHVCGLRTGGTHPLNCWGDNRTRQLGFGAAPALHPFIDPMVSTLQVGSNEDWTYVAAGGNHGCAVRPYGSGLATYCWGATSHGQVGTPPSNALQSTRVLAADGNALLSAGTSSGGIVATAFSTCTATNAGSATYCWGDNGRGQLARGDYDSRYLPNALDDKWTSLGAGANHVCGAPYSSGARSCWGSNGDDAHTTFQLGNSTVTALSSPTPVAIDPNTYWYNFGGGGRHTCALAGQTLHCWGANDRGQLGINSQVDQASMQQVNAPNGEYWMSFSTGVTHTCGITSVNNLYCWGDNSTGAIGGGSAVASFDAVMVPNPIANGGSWQAVSAGDGFTCGIKTDKSLWCWGDNAYGQLGKGTNEVNDENFGGKFDAPQPTGWNGSNDWYTVVAGGQHACAILGNPVYNTGVPNSVYCWGRNHSNQLGRNDAPVDRSVIQGTSDNGAIPAPPTAKWYTLALGAAHTCGVNSFNEVSCWGDNTFGQLATKSTDTDLWRNQGEPPVLTP